jgi:hypothetical protein
MLTGSLLDRFNLPATFPGHFSSIDNSSRIIGMTFITKRK